jgi:hypothetical protein
MKAEHSKHRVWQTLEVMPRRVPWAGPEYRLREVGRLWCRQWLREAEQAVTLRVSIAQSYFWPRGLRPLGGPLYSPLYGTGWAVREKHNTYSGLSGGISPGLRRAMMPTATRACSGLLQGLSRIPRSFSSLVERVTACKTGPQNENMGGG